MKPIATSKIQTSQTIILLFSTLTLALGVALGANYLTNFLGYNYMLITISVILITSSLFIINKVINPAINLKTKIDGGFYFDVDNLEENKIIGYEFNSDINTYLNAITVENKAYKHAMYSKGKNFSAHYNPNTLDFYNLAAACAEFLFLHKLGLHLNSYFVENEANESLITKISRNKLSQEILSNRVLELITRNYQEREAFYTRDNDKIGKICFAMGKNGEVYNHIELELPLGSTISRQKNNEIKIENKVFEIIYQVKCQGFNTTVDRNLIIGKYKPLNLVTAILSIKIKKKYFVSEKDLMLYQWLDSFLLEFEEYMSVNKLEERSHIQLIKTLKVLDKVS